MGRSRDFGAALIVSIIALVKSSRAQREANNAQNRILEIEEKRESDRVAATRQAELRARLEKPKSTSYRLCIINEGVAEARNVRLKLDGKPLSEHPLFPQTEQIGRVIGPN